MSSCPSTKGWSVLIRKRFCRVPAAAESWDISPDGLVYTFHLRKNARWSNGDPVTARDFVESYHRMLMPSLAAQYSYMLYPVTNAEAFNTNGITILARSASRRWTITPCKSSSTVPRPICCR